MKKYLKFLIVGALFAGAAALVIYVLPPVVSIIGAGIAGILFAWNNQSLVDKAAGKINL